jgi:hypothetical protein
VTCGESDLWAMNPDGTGLRRVIDTADNEIPEAWSPDGTRVLIDYSVMSSGPSWRRSRIRRRCREHCAPAMDKHGRTLTATPSLGPVA